MKNKNNDQNEFERLGGQSLVGGDISPLSPPLDPPLDVHSIALLYNANNRISIKM